MAEEPKLTVKQRKWLSAYIETGNATDAARQAGYSERSAQQIGSQNMLKLVVSVSELMERMGLDDRALIQKLKDGLNAETVKTASFEGAITDERTYIDFPTRHQYLETALKLKGKFPTKLVAEITGNGGGPIPIREIVIERLFAAVDEEAVV